MVYDVVVVGAGPAGSVAAASIAAEGFNVLLLEDHGEVGAPVHCSGLITQRTLDISGVGEGVVLNRITGSIIHTRGGDQITLGGNKCHALVIDRGAFDRSLAVRAEVSGAHLVMGARAVSVDRVGATFRIMVRREGKLEAIDSRLVIGADGSNSVVAKKVRPLVQLGSVLAIGGEIRGKVVSNDHVELFPLQDLAPGWFGWLIPSVTGQARIGVGTTDPRLNPRRLLEVMVDKYPHLRESSILRIQGGVIPISPPTQVAIPGIFLAGDAAGQVKPTSGGGILTGIVSAKLSANAAVQILSGKVEVDEGSCWYQSVWTQYLGNEFQRGYALRRLLLGLSPDEVDNFLNVFKVKLIQELAANYGDVDYPASLFDQLLKPGRVLHVLQTLPPHLWPRLAWLIIRWYRHKGKSDLSVLETLG